MLRIKEIKPVAKEVSNSPRRGSRGKTRIYFSVAGENIFENLTNRLSRPSKLYRTMLPEVLKTAGFPIDAKAYWNQNAGCSMCPCSPGFVVEGEFSKTSGFDFHVTITGDDPQEGKIDPDKSYIAGVRREQILADPTLPFGKPAEEKEFTLMVNLADRFEVAKNSFSKVKGTSPKDAMERLIAIAKRDAEEDKDESEELREYGIWILTPDAEVEEFEEDEIKAVVVCEDSEQVMVIANTKVECRAVLSMWEEQNS